MPNAGSLTRPAERGAATSESVNVTPLKSVRERTAVVIPARDEAADVGTVVAGIRATGLPVIVVDDYSADRTARVARASGASVLRLPFHAGSWAAIQTGMRYARSAGFEYVVTVDADGQHEPAEIDTLIRRIDAPDAPNVVIGACVARANRRRQLAWRLLRWLSGLTVEDLTSGFRIYDVRAVDHLTSQDHTLLEYQDVGVLLCLREGDLRTTEVAVSMQPRRHGGSRIFSSWPMVAYYLVYSALIGSSRRKPRTDAGPER